MSELKTHTDVTGREFFTDNKGNKYYHHKSLTTGEDVTTGLNGKEYRAQKDLYGNTTIRSSDGITYKAYKDIGGDTLIYGDDGSEYTTRIDYAGNAEIFQTKGNPNQIPPIPPVYPTDFNAYRDPFLDLSKEQIAKIYKDRYDKIDANKKDAIKKNSFAAIYYVVSILVAALGILITYVFHLCGNLESPTPVAYSDILQLIFSGSKILMLIPVITLIASLAANNSSSAFSSIRLGIWLNQEIITISFLAISFYSLAEVYIRTGDMSLLDLILITITFFSLIALIYFSTNTNSELTSKLNSGSPGVIIRIIMFFIIFFGYFNAINVLINGEYKYFMIYLSASFILLVCSFYCFKIYKQDKSTIEKEFRDLEEQAIREQKEKKESPRYNTFFKVEDVNDEEIDASLGMPKIDMVKSLAASVAANINKPNDTIEIDALREGSYTTASFTFNGWILEKYISQEKTYVNNAYEPLMETYCEDYYFVLERTGALKVYVFYINLDNLNTKSYGTVATASITRHDMSFVGGTSVTSVIKARSALALDCQIPYQKENFKEDDEIRCFNRYMENARQTGSRLPQYRENFDGIIDKLNALQQEYGTAIASPSPSTVIEKSPVPTSHLPAEDEKGELNRESALAILGLDSAPQNADALRYAFSRLAQLYHQEYGKTPDQAAYNTVKAAYDYLKNELFGE